MMPATTKISHESVAPRSRLLRRMLVSGLVAAALLLSQLTQLVLAQPEHPTGAGAGLPPAEAAPILKAMPPTPTGEAPELPPVPPPPQKHDVIKASMVLKVRSPDETADQLVKATEDLGGYFTERTNESLTVKVPVGRVTDFIKLCEEQGVVAERQYESQDVGQSLSEQRSRLGARQEVLEKYFAVLSESSAQGVLTVEQEITRLVAEIEQLKGSTRLLEHRASFAQVSVVFKFRDRSAPVNDGRSSFQWLNTMNLSSLVEDFRYGH